MTKDRPVVCFDIDGVIAGPCGKMADGRPDYAECEPFPQTVELLRRLNAQSIDVVLHTARWKVDRMVTEVWLRKHDIPYDKLILDKPLADAYIDDKSFPLGFDPNTEWHDRLIPKVRAAHQRRAR